VHLLQIWILPEQKGIEPGYEQKNFAVAEKQGKLKLVGSRNGRDGSITIHQDIDLYAAALSKGDSLNYTFTPNRVGWVQVARGEMQLNDQILSAGDGVAIAQESLITLQGKAQDTEVLLFDMAA
jgi:quercetin 2,3-dioxygenase